MKKIFLSVATVIVTHFIVRVIDRIKHPEELRREYEKAERYRRKLEADRRRQAYELEHAYLDQVRARPVHASTPSGKTRGKDLEDAAALAIYSGLDLQARPELAPESAMNAIGSCNGRFS